MMLDHGIKKGGLEMKRVAAFLLVFVLVCSSVTAVSAEKAKVTASSKQQKIVISVKPDIVIERNGVRQKFTDVNGRSVYPVIYNGSTYLPVRAIAGLLDQSIEWDSASKTIYVGKTLSDPAGSGKTSGAEAAVSSPAATYTSVVLNKPQYVNGYLKPDVLIMYNFVIQSFEDTNGKTVYPINYNGSTYLPVRGISRMMDKTIEWDTVSKTICIDDCVDETADKEDEPQTVTEQAISVIKKNLKDVFEREEMLYYEATSKTTSLKEAASAEEKQKIAATISEDLQKAQHITAEIEEIDSSKYASEQTEALSKIKDFADSTEYYILILENIAYLAAQDSDYSMMADTFLYFAMESQTKMEEARNALQLLK